MKIAVRGGHSLNCKGASGVIDETLENRKVYPAVIKYLKQLGYEVLDVTSNLPTQRQDLNYGVSKANNWGADLFISIHFNNAYNSYNGAIGTEAWLYMKDSNAKSIANRIINNIANLGFKNRGVKDGYNKGLYEIKHTTMTAIIVEVCFVEATKDVELYKKLGSDLIGKAIAEGTSNKKLKNPNEKKYTVNYCLEFQKWYNNVTKTRAPLVEDGIFGSKTQKALNVTERLLKKEY